jgi:hypothetical protein
MWSKKNLYKKIEIENFIFKTPTIISNNNK